MGRIAIAAASFVAALGVLFASPAAARGEADRKPERTVAMVTARIGGDADPELRNQVQESVRRGLQSAGYALVDNDALRRALRDTELVDCTSKTCLAQISEKVGARQFLRAEIEASGASYSVKLELLGLEGEALRTLEEACAVCTILELTELVQRLATSLVTTREAEPVPVLIVSRPEGAELLLDGKTLGKAPFSGKLPPGAHRITAHLPGHAEVDRAIDVNPAAEGETQRFEIIMATTAPVDSDPDSSGPRFRTWKWVAAGSGGALLITGIVLVALDGSGTCDIDMAECPERYESMGLGVTSMVLGLAAGGASGWMFMRDRRSERSPSAAIAPTRGGAFATVRWYW